MKRVSVRILIGLAVLLLAFPAFAQTEEPDIIQVGDTVTGSLTADAPAITYTLEADAEQAITVTLVSADFDTYLSILDEDGQVIGFNDDGDNTGTNSRIANFALPAGGSYQLLVESYDQHNGNPGETGDFVLVVTTSDAAPTDEPTAETPATAVPTLVPQPQNADGSISVGDTVNGTLSRGEPRQTYTLNAEPGQAVTITLTADGFDTYLTLLDDSGSVIAENDDDSNSTNSAVERFVLPESDSYQIVVESYDSHTGGSGATGDYTLSVVEQQVTRIEYSQTVNGNLTTAETAVEYGFTGQAGDVVLISLSSDDFDSYLRLYGTDGSELINNDDSGGSLDSLIGPFELPDTGTYVIRASSLSGDGTGAFTLTLNKTELAEVTYGEPLEVEFKPNTVSKYFTFTGTPGDLISISVDSDDTIDTSLTLNDPYNSQLAYDDDSGSGYDPEIYNQPLTLSGTYTIQLQAVTPGSTGTVTLTVKRTPPPSLDEDTQTVSFTTSQTAQAVMFSANADETVTLTLASNGDMTGSPSVTVTQDGMTLATISASTVMSTSLSFVTPTNGDVIVQINDYSYSGVSYDVSLERADE